MPASAQPQQPPSTRSSYCKGSSPQGDRPDSFQLAVYFAKPGVPMSAGRGFPYTQRELDSGLLAGQGSLLTDSMLTTPWGVMKPHMSEHPGFLCFL